MSRDTDSCRPYCRVLHCRTRQSGGGGLAETGSTHEHPAGRTQLSPVHRVRDMFEVIASPKYTLLFFQDLKSRSNGACPSTFSVARTSVNETIIAQGMQLGSGQSAVSWRVDRK